MKKIIVIGASSHYGVGSAVGSWVDMYRKKLLKESFGPGGAGEGSQIYNLSIPGANSSHTAAFMEPFVQQLNDIAPKLSTEIIISIGMNNTKAVDTRDNFLSTPEGYVADMTELIKSAQELAAKVTVVGLTPVDEALTNPKLNPLTGGKSYYTNDRIRMFEDALSDYCKQSTIEFIPLLDAAIEWGWQDHLSDVCKDGIHVTSVAQEWLYNLLIERGAL